MAGGVAGAGAIIAREVTSLWRLRDVETIRRRLIGTSSVRRDAQKIIADIVAVVPREPETQAALETFQRQVQLQQSVVSRSRSSRAR